jgi:hypothetical protein
MLFFHSLPLKALLKVSWMGVALGAPLLYPLFDPQPGVAQSTLPVCPPPASQEYLLLVRGSTETERAEIASILPAENTVLVCQYLGESLVRAGGFTSLETANAWATYMTTVADFESFVSRPAEGQPAAASSELTGDEAVRGEATQDESVRGEAVAVQDAVRGEASRTAYQPRRLEAGYAVLVDYGNRPELATAVGQVVRPVGLAVYRQRAYLLADYTSDANSAAVTLQRLNDAQMAAIVVDAEEVVRMSEEVAQF